MKKSNNQILNYIEGERVCTKIGGGFGTGQYNPVVGELPLIEGDYESVRQKLWDMVVRFRDCTQGPVIAIGEHLNPCHNNGNENGNEKLQCFYHPDHLGSSSFITNTIGKAEQHIQYMPFGETFVDQQNGYNARYTFSAKEKDNETSYSYFGARYYDSELSVWLSVDAMSDKYPSTSPYAYCENNPVIFFDPNGDFKTHFGAKLFAITHGGGEIIKAKSGKYTDQYYVQKTLPARKITNNGTRQVKNQDKNVAGTFQSDEIGVGLKISYGWGYFGQGSSKRTIFEKAFDWIWDGFKSFDDRQGDLNKTPVQTNDPYPNQTFEDLNNPFLDPNMNPNISDKKYNDGGNLNQSDPAGTQNRPEENSKTYNQPVVNGTTGDTMFYIVKDKNGKPLDTLPTTTNQSE